MNATEGQEHLNITTSKQYEEVLLWSYIAVATFSCIIGVFGNGLVIYLANQRKNKRGPLIYLNRVVRNLAVTDFLYCALAIPLTAIWYYWGKFWRYF